MLERVQGGRVFSMKRLRVVRSEEWMAELCGRCGRERGEHRDRDLACPCRTKAVKWSQKGRFEKPDAARVG